MVKHHVMNANLMRNGCDFCIYVSTAHEFDGSDAGARPDEAKSWGKIRVDANPVKVYASELCTHHAFNSSNFDVSTGRNVVV